MFKFQTDCCGDTVLYLRSCHNPNNREITVQRHCYARVLHMTRKSTKWTWAEPFEINIKIEKELNFVVDDSRLFFDVQEAKKVNERTVV